MIVNQLAHDPLLKVVQLVLANCISFGYDGYDVDLAVKRLHRLQVERLERMSRRTDEVQADVDARVVNLLDVSIEIQLALNVLLKLAVYVISDRLVTILLVDLIAETGRLHDGQLEVYVVLPEIDRVGIEAHFGLVVTARLQMKARVEERIHQRALANSGLAF